jgi:hypothetical protein
VRDATSASMALQFINKGYPKVFVLKNGQNDWEKAGYPVEPK